MRVLVSSELADDVWEGADLVLKVKEPTPAEYHRMRKGQVLFTFLHLAALRELTDVLLDSGVTAIAYETVQTRDGHLPLLAPMSQIAGRLAPQVGAYHLMGPCGGRGVLPGGVTGVHTAQVVVLGAGMVGQAAASIAVGMQAQVPGRLADRGVCIPGARPQPGDRGGGRTAVRRPCRPRGPAYRRHRGRARLRHIPPPVHAEIGTAPLAFRNTRRLQAAATLLRLTDMTIRAIARTLGYADEFHLSRRFHAHYGLPPSDYRRHS